MRVGSRVIERLKTQELKKYQEDLKSSQNVY